MKNPALLLLISVLILGCDKEGSDDIDGNWSDIIKLSTKNVELGAMTDSVIITTEGVWWWIDGIDFSDSTYSYYNRQDINLESNSYIIEEDGFVVERRNKTKLFVKLDENTTGDERIMGISLEAGDYFDFVTIKQSAK